MMFGYATPVLCRRQRRSGGTCANQIENPNALAGTTTGIRRRLFGRQLHQLLRPVAAGRAPILGHLASLHVPSQCAPGAFYLLNNYVPAFIGSGATIRSTTARHPAPSRSSATSAIS